MEYAGIIDQHIHAAKTIARGGEFGLGAAIEKYVGAVTDELLSDSVADAGRSACDDDGLILCGSDDGSPLFL